jgi:hypothetical protein
MTHRAAPFAESGPNPGRRRIVPLFTPVTKHLRMQLQLNGKALSCLAVVYTAHPMADTYIMPALFVAKTRSQR